jgi:hypothetical protein
VRMGKLAFLKNDHVTKEDAEYVHDVILPAACVRIGSLLCVSPSNLCATALQTCLTLVSYCPSHPV